MINNISLKNFKCFENVEIPLKNVNLLTGLNGMGKSSLIQAILLLRQSYISNKLESGLELSGVYVELGQGMDILYEKAGKDDDISIIINENENVYKYEFSYQSDSTLLMNKNQSNAERIADIVSTDNFVYLSAYRIEPLKFYSVANKKDLDRREFGNDGEYALQYLKEHGPDIMNQSEGEDGRDLNQMVQEWLKEISPGVNAVVDINKILNVSELRFQFIEGKNKTNAYRCKNVGFGLTYVLPIIVALLSAQKGDIVILENPEAHIHPAGQRKLGELIAQVGQSGVQIIVETHSDHIMNGIRVAVKKQIVEKEKTNFVYFYKDSKDNYSHKCILPQIDKNGKFNKWPEGFFDEWDNSLIDLL